MPVFIGDVLESCGGPILDLSTQQVKGLGVFTSVSDRNDLSSLMRSDGYLSVVGTTYPQISVHTGGDWEESDNWDSMLKFVGSAVKVSWFNGNISTTEGFLVGAGTADWLTKGDVFQVSGINDVGDGNYAGVNDGAYLVVDDTWNNNGSPNVGPSLASDNGPQTALVILEVIQDYINNGTIIKLSETKLLLESLPNAEEIIDGELNAALLSSNNSTDLAISVTASGGAITDAKISVNQFISMLGAGIADEYVSGGYGDVTVYGGSAGVTSSGGDIDGDGVVGVSDILTLLGVFGETVDPEVELQDTVVSVPMSWGSANEPDANLRSQVENFWRGGSNRYYVYANWGQSQPAGLSNLSDPAVTSGAATVAIFSANPPSSNSDNHYTDNAVSLGDPFVFSGTSSNDFTINAFPGSPSRLVLREPPTNENAYSGVSPVLPSGKRNSLTFNAEQASDFNSGSNFQTFVRVKKYSSVPTSTGDLGSNVMSTRVVTVGDISFSSLGVQSTGGKAFFNFINPSVADTSQNETQEVDISTLYYEQHGQNLFGSENTISCVGVGVELGIRITNATNSTSRILAQGGISSFENGEFVISNEHSAILQNIEVVLVPHNN